MVLSRPDFGEPRIDQATPATSGGTNNGTRLAAPMKPFHGVLVRTTIHENASPDRDRERPCPRCRRSASSPAHGGHWRCRARLTKLSSERIEHAEPVYHRVGVGERTQEQHRDRVEDKKCQHGKECARPQPASDDAKSCRALGLCYPARQMQRLLPSRRPSLRRSSTLALAPVVLAAMGSTEPFSRGDAPEWANAHAPQIAAVGAPGAAPPPAA